MATDMPALTPRLSGAVLVQASEAVDEALGLKTTLTLLVRAIVAGKVVVPASPDDYGPLDRQPTIRMKEEVWNDPGTGAPDPRFEAVGARSALVRDLVYALADGRASVTVECKTGG